MADAGDDAEQKKPVFTFKKGKRRQAVRKQKCESDKDSADSDSEENDEGNVAIKQVERKRRNNPLVHSTKRVKLGFSKNSQSESSSEESEQESAVTVSYKSSRSGKKKVQQIWEPLQWWR